MKAIFKGKILECKMEDYYLETGSKYDSSKTYKMPTTTIRWETIHERRLVDVLSNIYINDSILLENELTVKIEKISKDLDGNIYYYTDHVINGIGLT